MRLEIALSVAVVTVALVGAWWFRPQPTTQPTVSTVIVEPEATTTIVVHVSGAVRRPGLVSLPADARVADAVAGAGGGAQDADLGLVNLAAPLADGQQIVIAKIGDSAEASSSGLGLLRVNSASAGELEELPGVGPVLAGRIVAHRDAVGGFRVIEDLLDVPGIGEAKLASLRDLIVVP